MKISLKLIFSDEAFSKFKAHADRHARASVSAEVHNLGNNSKNKCRVREYFFWKFNRNSKDEIKKNIVFCQEEAEKRKRDSHVPTNRLAQLSVWLIIYLRFLMETIHQAQL